MTKLISININKSDFIKYVILSTQKEDDSLYLHESTIDFVGNIATIESAYYTDYISMDNADELMRLFLLYLNDMYQLQVNISTRLGATTKVDISITSNYIELIFRGDD